MKSFRGAGGWSLSSCVLSFIFFLVLSAGLLNQAVLAQEPEAVKQYNITPGPLTNRLNQFGRDAGILLSFSSEITNGLETRGVQGS